MTVGDQIWLSLTMTVTMKKILRTRLVGGVLLMRPLAALLQSFWLDAKFPVEDYSFFLSFFLSKCVSFLCVLLTLTSD